MARHYPHARTKENRQGLHYSGFSGLIHKPTIDYQRDLFLPSAKSRPNPLSWANVFLDPASCSGGSCSITAELSAWEVLWNGSAFEQGPRPKKAGPFNLAKGSLDTNTLAYSLNWKSQIKGGPFGGVNAFWHLEGTYVPVSAVPIPAAAWLFFSGLVGLIAVGKRKPGKATAA